MFVHNFFNLFYKLILSKPTSSLIGAFLSQIQTEKSRSIIAAALSILKREGEHPSMIKGFARFGKFSFSAVQAPFSQSPVSSANVSLTSCIRISPRRAIISTPYIAMPTSRPTCA